MPIQVIPNEVYQEAGLAAYDERQLITELYKRGVSEHTILSAFYALDAIEDHKMEIAMEVASEIHSKNI